MNCKYWQIDTLQYDMVNIMLVMRRKDGTICQEMKGFTDKAAFEG